MRMRLPYDKDQGYCWGENILMVQRGRTRGVIQRGRPRGVTCMDSTSWASADRFTRKTRGSLGVSVTASGLSPSTSPAKLT